MMIAAHPPFGIVEAPGNHGCRGRHRPLSGGNALLELSSRSELQPIFRADVLWATRITKELQKGNRAEEEPR